jgi:mono/diheme cytochrome c family protein
MPTRTAALALLLAVAPTPAAPPDRRIDYVREVQPVLARACYACHGPDKQKSGFRLDVKAAALQGGDQGPAIVPGKSADSPLARYVSGTDPNCVMPPKGPRLKPEEVAALRAWIDQGAAWPESASGASADKLDWWSLRPLTRPAVPGLARNPIDAFILAKLKEKGLSPSPEADRRTLIRRVTFDLTGLPPTPEEVEAFLKDASPDAYEKVVDRLLASPHYGERWARHWLDVVHYGDTHGYDKDQPRPNAWPYRDYVIRSFNADKPYSRFVQEQLAGDVLFPGTAEGVEALGFIAAGPWDLIGHAEVAESKIDGQIARHLDRDDMVANTMMTFVSMTVQCAQCHNHKFDPIAQEDYYSLQAVFAALDRADRKYYPDPAVAKRAAELQARREGMLGRKKDLDARLAHAAGPRLAEIDRQLEAAKRSPPGERPEFGYHSAIEAKPDRAKWVQVDLGGPVAVERIELVGCHDTFADIGAGFGFPVRFRVELCDDPAFRQGVAVVLDRTAADVPNPGVTPQQVPVGGRTARYVRVTATKLAPRQNDFIFALGELSVYDAAGRNRALNAAVTALDSIEAPPRWRKANLVDGYYYGRGTTPLLRERQELLERTADADTRRGTAELDRELAAVDAELGKLPPPQVVYAGTVHTGSGAFAGTGAAGGKPRPIAVLRRGDVRQRLKEAGPGTLAVVRDLPSRFDLPAGHAEGERRAALARWITDPRNPLTWRSAVNRVWRWHFGRGIVESPNDFGRMGQLPTHPELLDFLAVEFMHPAADAGPGKNPAADAAGSPGGGSLKRLHRLIVTSATYRQQSVADEARTKLDADNAYLWRMIRRRLEAEEIRDSVLFVSGKLDARMFGPGFRDFVVEKPEHSPHYQYDQHDPDDPRCFRRSVYRFLVRSQQEPFMTALDCADPSLQVDRRNETLSALQALALLNDGFMLAMAKHFAERMTPQGEDVSSRVTAAVRLALGRGPTPEEARALTAYAEKHGLTNACRVLFNLNEFVFVD